MKRIKVAAGVLNQTPLAWESNRDNIVAAIVAARQVGARLLCLPELCITGYGCEDAFHSSGVTQTSESMLISILPETTGMIVSVGLPIWYRGGLFNVACLLVDGQLSGLVGKQNLAGEGLHYEPRWFKPWPNDAFAEIHFAGRHVPLGDLVFDCGGVRIGFEICEDAWVADRPGLELAQRGVDVLLNPSASHFAFDKHKVRRQLVLDGSRAFHTSYIYANLLGNEAGRSIYDGDAMIASDGVLLANGRRFSYADFELTTAVVDIEKTRMSRARSSSFPVELKAKLAHLVKCDFQFPADAQPAATPVPPAWEAGDYLKQEEFTRAIALGLFDYLRKSNSQGFVVSLSGGADSAAVATLVALMIQLASDSLGMDGFRKKLGHLTGIDQIQTAHDAVHRMLTCAYQSTRNSSETTRSAASQVANGLGAVFYDLDVDAIVESYKSLISDAIGRPLQWDRDDLALQNIQARARGPSVWMLANLSGSLLLATSNRSEAAVGYATMDGDTCGGLSPIAGIDKAFLREWLSWMEVTGVYGLEPFPELRVVNVQVPTAELRPQQAGQTDEADLMPYPLLDAIELAAIRDKKPPLEVFLQMEERFPAYQRDQLATWVERFFRLWCRNQWKRERYAPSFHVDDENLDPKTWCRFPILSGGYELELRQLREYLDTSAT